VTYTIAISKWWPDAADNVTLSDPLARQRNICIITEDFGPVPQCTLPAVGATGTVVCNFPQLAPGTTASIHTKWVRAGTSTPLNNTASATTDSFDSNGANNSSTVSTAVASSPT